ncbi:Unconventional myosin-XVIIIa [Taenia solium]|eukprot:TsM_000123000 transcript=TsM_000123000 gene=TsM_000123000
MTFSGVSINRGLTTVPNISKEAVQRVHEQIFGNPFSLSNGSLSECQSSRNHSPRTRFPCPEFSLNCGDSYKVVVDRSETGDRLGFCFDLDHSNRAILRFHSPNFSLGFLPGDMVLSINGVDFQQLSIDDMNAKLSPDCPPELKIVLLPSEDSTEWSLRSIHVDFSCFQMLLNAVASATTSHSSYYEDLFSQQDHKSNRICLRNWIKQAGSLSGISDLIKELYLHLLRDVTADSKGLYCVGDLVLVTHRDGYSIGTVAEILPEDVYQVTLLPNKQLLNVTWTDVGRANSKELEGMEDLMLLRHLNEVALVFNLHARVHHSLPYTYVGDFALLAFNPMRSLDIYNDAVKRLFFKCQHRLDMPPHIYSVAQTILARMEGLFLARGGSPSSGAANADCSTTITNPNSVCTASLGAATIKVPTQAVCLLGRSGSGKSVNTEYLIEYLLSQCPSDSVLTARKVRAVMCLLDAFTCSRTLLNSNASRCLRLFTVEFVAEWQNASGVHLNPSGLFVDILLLDKFRVTRRPQGEPTFHIFYYFLAGLEYDVRTEFMLEDLTSPNLFMTPLQRTEDQALAKSRWEAVRTAARVLGRDFEEAFLNGVCRLLAAIYHLGCAGATPPCTAATPTPASPRRFINRNAAERAARLLGCASVERLTSDVFSAATTNVNPSSSRLPSNLELLGGFVANLYAIATNTLRDLINKALNPRSRGILHSNLDVDLRERTARVVVVDPPGLQTPEAGGRMSGGSFEDLLYNYTNECLLQLYRDCQCQADKSGNIRCTNSDFVEFLDNPPDNLLYLQLQRTPSKSSGSPSQACSASPSQSDEEASITWTTEKCGNTDSAARAGLLWLLDYAFYTGDMKTFLRLIAQKYVKHKLIHVSRGRILGVPRLAAVATLTPVWSIFVEPLECDSGGPISPFDMANQLPLLEKSTNNHRTSSAFQSVAVLKAPECATCRPLLRSIGDSMDEGASASTLSVSSTTGLVESFILDTKYVMDLLRTCCLEVAMGDIRWVHCLLPVASAGLWQVAAASVPTTAETTRVCVRNPHARFCVPLVRAQLHAISLATDLIYLKSAFTLRLLQVSTTNSNHLKMINSPPHSVSEDLITVTEMSNQNNSENGGSAETEGTLLKAASFSSGDKLTSPNSTSQASLDASANLQSDAVVNHTVNESADTYNFVFNTTSNNFPWEQLLSLAPADRGLIKQLRFQLEETEESKELLLRKQRILMADLEECQQQLNQEKRDKHAAELRCQTAHRRNSDLQCRVEELEEELEEANRKQRRSALTGSVTPSFNPYAGEVTQLMEERNAMREEIAYLQERLAAATTEKAGAADMELVYQKAKVHELEGRLELETSTKQRLQSTVERLKGQLEQLIGEREKLLAAVQSERQNARGLSRSLREAVEDKERAERRLAEEAHRRYETSNEVSSCVQEQLRLQHELSHLLLRCKEEELRSMVMHSRLPDDGNEIEATGMEGEASDGKCSSDVTDGSDVGGEDKEEEHRTPSVS